MANVSVLNTTGQLSGKTLCVAENDQTISGAWTFTGNQLFNGNITFGNAVADTVTFTGTITSNLIFTDATYDIGASGATRPRDLFLSRNATLGADLVFSASAVVRRDTSDAADSGYTGIAGGGALNTGRGGILRAFGNEEATTPGHVWAQLGNVAGSQFRVDRADGTQVVAITGADGVTALRFAATQVSSADANTLDDYEEGTFTPTIGSAGGGTPTYSTQAGRYIKVGKKVWFNANVALASKGTLAAGAVLLQSLPFSAVNAVPNETPLTVGRFVNMTTSVVHLASAVSINSNQAVFYHLTAAATGVTATAVADVGATWDISVSGVYEAAA